MNIGNCALSNISIHYGTFTTCPEVQKTITFFCATILLAFFILILIGLKAEDWKYLIKSKKENMK